MLNDDTQRYGLLKDDALIILCTDFKIGVYTFKSCLQKRRFLGVGISRGATMRRSEVKPALPTCPQKASRVRGFFKNRIALFRFGRGLSCFSLGKLLKRRGFGRGRKYAYICTYDILVVLLANLACKNGDLWVRALPALSQGLSLPQNLFLKSQ